MSAPSDSIKLARMALLDLSTKTTTPNLFDSPPLSLTSKLSGIEKTCSSFIGIQHSLNRDLTGVYLP